MAEDNNKRKTEGAGIWEAVESKGRTGHTGMSSANENKRGGYVFMSSALNMLKHISNKNLNFTEKKRFINLKYY